MSLISNRRRQRLKKWKGDPAAAVAVGFCLEKSLIFSNHPLVNQTPVSVCARAIDRSRELPPFWVKNIVKADPISTTLNG
jgi:hypothetical protein